MKVQDGRKVEHFSLQYISQSCQVEVGVTCQTNPYWQNESVLRSDEGHVPAHECNDADCNLLLRVAMSVT